MDSFPHSFTERFDKQFSERFKEGFNEHSGLIATAVSVILIMLMSMSVANTVMFVLEAMNPPDLDVIDSSQQMSQKTRGPAYKMSTLELFGKPEALSVPKAIDAPATKLNLELQGVFISDVDTLSTAIIAEKNKSGELYQIGDRLPGNATLAAVHHEHVLIRRGTRMEKLMFSDSKFQLTSTRSDSRSTRPSLTGPTGEYNRQTDIEKIRDRIRRKSTGPAMERGSTSARQSMQRYKERLTKDPSGTLSELGISPVEEGQSKGYRVGDQAGSTLKQSGLQPGDVILSVNGRPIGVAANDSALMEQVMASSRVRVEVQRGSRRFYLTVPVPK